MGLRSAKPMWASTPSGRREPRPSARSGRSGAGAFDSRVSTPRRPTVWRSRSPPSERIWSRLRLSNPGAPTTTSYDCPLRAPSAVSSSTPRASRCPARGCGGPKGTRATARASCRPATTAPSRSRTCRPGASGCGRTLVEGTPAGPPSTAPTWTEASTRGDKVILTIDLGLALDVVVENWPEASPVRWQPVQARLFDESATSGTGVAFAQVSQSGRVRFRGLQAARRYTFWVGPVGDSFVRQAGLTAGRETRVRLVPGGSITVRLQGLSSRATWIGVLAEADGLSVEGKKQDDGRYRIRGLPEGRWTIRALAGGENAPRVSAQADASTGAEVTLTLQPEAPPR